MKRINKKFRRFISSFVHMPQAPKTQTTKEIKKQIEDNAFKRYVLSVVSGQEQLVVKNLKERVKKQWLEESVVDYLVPIVNETKMTKLKKIVREKKLYPWYVFVKSKMNDKIRYVIRNTPGVRIIVGAETRPVPLTDKEYENIVQQIQEKNERSELVVPFHEWDIVLIKSGDFENMKGVIREIDTEKWFAIINVEMLGRITPVMIDFEKIELAV
jgi:transcription termination/antitermination protein NusG